MRRPFMLYKYGFDWVLRMGRIALRFRLDGVDISAVETYGKIEVTSCGVVSRPEVPLTHLTGFGEDNWWAYFCVGRMGVTVRYRSRLTTVAEVRLGLADANGVEEDIGFIQLTLNANGNPIGCHVSDTALTEDFLHRLLFTVQQTAVKGAPNGDADGAAEGEP